MRVSDQHTAELWAALNGVVAIGSACHRLHQNLFQNANRTESLFVVAPAYGFQLTETDADALEQALSTLADHAVLVASWRDYLFNPNPQQLEIDFTEAV